MLVEQRTRRYHVWFLAQDIEMSLTSSNPVQGLLGLGAYLRKARDDMSLTLRDVESVTKKGVSNAYLSQIEQGKIAKPSPSTLYTLSKALNLSYEELMARAGYLPTEDQVDHPSARRMEGRYEINNLTADEEAELLRYLKYIRSERK